MSRQGLRERAPARRVLAPLVVALVVLAVTAGIASAHANLVRSNPPAGAALASPPTTVQLWFSEPLEPSFSNAVVYDSNRQRVDAGDSHVAPNDPLSLVVSVKPGLPRGTYVIAWEAQSSQDGHITRGIVPFGVGVASAAGVALPSDVTTGAVSGSPLEMALRWLSLLAAAALVGGFVFWTLQGFVLRGRAGASEDAAAPLLPNQGRLAWIALVVLLVSSFFLLVYDAGVAANVGVLAALGAPLARLVGTRVGEISAARIALGLVLGGFLAARHRLAGGAVGAAVLDRVALVPGAALLATISLTSHSADSSLASPVGDLPIGLGNDFLHLAATAIWVGGLLQLAALAPRPGRPAGEASAGAARARLLGALVPRFSYLAGASLVVLGLTGLVEALQHVGTLDNLLNTAYGEALLVKILLILPLVALATVNHFVVRPAFVGARVNAPGAALRRAVGTIPTFGWTIRLEALFAVAVIAVVGVMTSISPAQQAGVVGNGSLTLSAPAGDLSTSFTIAPGAPGLNRYAVDLSGPNGAAPSDVQSVVARFTFLDSNLGVADVPLSATGPGRYEGQSSDLAVAGRWQVDVIVRRSGQADATATVQFQVTPTGAQPIQPPPLSLDWHFYVGLAVILVGLFALVRGYSMRRLDLRRAAVVAACGIGLCGSGAYLSGRNVQQAQAQSAALAQAQTHPATPQSIADGAVVFRQNCAVCHGLDARGDGPMAASLNPRPSDLIVHVPLHPDADLEDWIANGFPGSAMPAFKDKLTDQQRWDVLNYLKSLVGEASAVSVATPAAGPPSAAGSPSPAASPAATGAATVAGAAPASPSPAALPSPTPSPTDGGLSQRTTIGNLDAAVQIQPGIYQPATIEVRLANPDGTPPGDVRRVDLEVAMEGMDHGARGIVADPAGPGLFRARAMLLAMEGPWWLAVRVEQANGQVSSGVLGFHVPRDPSNGAVSAMYTRPPGPVQVEDVAVYPKELTPSDLNVTAGHPVRLEVMYVDHPGCGPTVRVEGQNSPASVAPDGLAELTFTPSRSGTVKLTCGADGLVVAGG